MNTEKRKRLRELKPCPFCGSEQTARSKVITSVRPPSPVIWECGSFRDRGETYQSSKCLNRRAAPAPDQSDRERARMFLSGLHIEGDDGINRGPIDPQSVLFSLASLLAEVRAEERERCAKVCEGMSQAFTPCADAIRGLK